jgi:hypothetical protein
MRKQLGVLKCPVVPENSIRPGFARSGRISASSDAMPARTHLSLHKDALIPRAVQTIGRTLAVPVLGGLHHQYFRA